MHEVCLHQVWSIATCNILMPGSSWFHVFPYQLAWTSQFSFVGPLLSTVQRNGAAKSMYTLGFCRWSPILSCPLEVATALTVPSSSFLKTLPKSEALARQSSGRNILSTSFYLVCLTRNNEMAMQTPQVAARSGNLQDPTGLQRHRSGWERAAKRRMDSKPICKTSRWNGVSSKTVYKYFCISMPMRRHSLHIPVWGILPDTCRGFSLGTWDAKSLRCPVTSRDARNTNGQTCAEMFKKRYTSKAPVVCEAAVSAPFSLWPFSSLWPGFLQNPRPRAFRILFISAHHFSTDLFARASLRPSISCSHQSPTSLLYKESNGTL